MTIARTASLIAAAILVLALPSCKKPNHPPDAPAAPAGPDSAAVGDTLTFSASAIDPDDDSVSLRFDWGDGDTSKWSELVPGGDMVSVAHVWAGPGMYQVRALARDNQDARSGPSDALGVAITAATVFPDSLVAAVEMSDDVTDDVVVSPDGEFVYFALSRGICPIRTADNEVPAEIWLPDEVDALELSRDGTTLFAASMNGAVDTIFCIGTQNCTITNGTPLRRLIDLAVSPSGESLWALSYDSLHVLRTSDMTVIGGLPLPGEDWHAMAMARDGNHLYVGCDSELVAIRTRDGSVDGLIATEWGNEFMCLSADGTRLFTEHLGGLLVVNTDEFEIIDTLSLRVELIGTPAAGDYVYATTDDSLPDGQHLYVATHEMAYEYACPEPGLVDSPWLKFHHDLRNTGRVSGR